MLAAVAVSLVLSSCAADAAAEPTGPASDERKTAPSKREATPEPAPVPETMGFEPRLDELKAGDWVVDYLQPYDLKFGPRTVAHDAEKYISVFGSDSELSVAVLPPSDPDRDVEGRSFGVQQDPDADSALIVSSLERERSSGLQAGGTLFVVRTYDDTGEETREVEVPGPGEGYMGSTSLFGDVAVLDAHDEAKDRDVYLAIDLAEGEVLWTRECDGRYYGADAVVSANGVYVIKCGRQFEGVGLRDGVSKWTAAPETMADAEVMRLPSSGDYFSWYGEQVFSASTGKPVSPPAGQVILDPVTGLLATYIGSAFRTDDGLVEGLHVSDIATGETVFQVPQAEVEKLGGIELIGAFDRRLWFWGEDGLDIVDLRTGEQDPLAPTRDGQPGGYRNIPLAAGDTWVLMGEADGLGGLAVTQLYRDPAGGIELDDIPQTSR